MTAKDTEHGTIAELEKEASQTVKNDKEPPAKKPAAKKSEPKKKAPKKSTGKKAGSKTDKEKKSRQKQVDEILAEAEKKGIKTNFFFSTTLKRYVTQLDIMSNLEKQIEKDGELVTKEYVKGRENIYVNPAVTEFNKTSTAANGTVATLMKILTSLTSENAEGASKLQKMLEDLNDE